MNKFERQARSYVTANYPQAIAAFLGGSAGTGDASPSSDLDIVVILGEQDAQVAFVETTTHEGRLVETFVYGMKPGGPEATKSTDERPGIERWLAKGRAQARPVVDRLIADSIVLVGGAVAEELRRDSRRVMAAGPPPLTDDELDLARYTLSSLIDDLRDVIGDDDAAAYVIAATTWRTSSELSLRLERHWIGTGKWLLRELRSAEDPFGLAAWAAGDRDPRALLTLATRVLDAAGGYLQTGMLRGTRPSHLSTGGSTGVRR